MATTIRHLTVAVSLLTLTNCTAMQRNYTGIGIGVGLCGGGKAATALGEGWGAALEAVGCWLADWAAAREDRRREAERAAKAAAERGLELAPAPVQLDPLDEAAIDLAAKHAAMVADPCPANYDAMVQALERCKAIQSTEPTAKPEAPEAEP